MSKGLPFHTWRIASLTVFESILRSSLFDRRKALLHYHRSIKQEQIFVVSREWNTKEDRLQKTNLLRVLGQYEAKEKGPAKCGRISHALTRTLYAKYAAGLMRVRRAWAI